MTARLPDVLVTLQALGLDVGAAERKYRAWAAAHPGESMPLEEVAAVLFNGQAPAAIADAVQKAPQEFLAWVQQPTGEIIEGDDPSISA